MKKPIVLTILDGYGLRDKKNGNAVKLANNKEFNRLWEMYPHTKLVASGEDVGLPKGQMGNSEVGHTNIGAGRIVYQPLELINKKIEAKSFFENKNILKVINHVKNNNSSLHILGLLSDGGIHSHIDHLFALIDMCKKEGIKKVYYHVFLDGRDTLPNKKKFFLDKLNDKINKTGLGEIATISGRYYAMDRDNRWDRIKLVYDAIVNGIGPKFYNYDCLVNQTEKENVTDEFVIPTVLNEDGIINDNDGLIVFNFRPDRLRELFMAITNPKFSEFDTKKLENIKLVTMMPVSLDVIAENAYQKEKLNNTLGEYIASFGKRQLRIAETEKYAHVTYFFDGGVEKELKGCDKILIPSPHVATYDLKPEMSAIKITEKLLEKIQLYDLVILNFANGDMVGHTGVLSAAIKGVEIVDLCLSKIFNKIEELGGVMLITADHGNCEEMLDANNNVLTSHTTNLVPFIITDKTYQLVPGKLADIAPTILEIMGIKKPAEMTGKSLLKSLK